MNATASLYTYLNTHNSDELQRTDILVILKRITDEHQAAIAAAVRQERKNIEAIERVLKLIDGYMSEQNQSELLGHDYGVMTWGELRDHAKAAIELTSAIRARSEASHVQA